VKRILTVLIAALPIVADCGQLPAPAQYDHAMLREFFGKSPVEVEVSFGTPSSTTQTDPASPPQNATPEEQENFKKTTEKMTDTYSTKDGDLIFHFNLLEHVYAITYAGRSVSAP
jgi:hypothetical protein